MDALKLQQMQELEKTLGFLIKSTMTIDEKLKALEDSYWRSHNSGYCDHIASMLMGGEDNAQTRIHDLDCQYKYEVSSLIDLLKEYKEE